MDFLIVLVVSVFLFFAGLVALPYINRDAAIYLVSVLENYRAELEKTLEEKRQNK